MSGPAPTSAQRRGAVDRASRQARWATWAALVSAALGASSLPYGSNVWSGPLVSGAELVRLSSSIASIAAFVLFLFWLHSAVGRARALGAPVRWGQGQALLAFVVPLVSLVLPYYVMTALHRASDPSTLSDAPRYRDRIDASYREGARELLSPPRWSLPAPILAWCIAFDAVALSGLVPGPLFLGVLAGRSAEAALHLAAGALCALVVRSIDARQRERCHRLERPGDAGVASSS
jgi:hypothetical protein